tara:strand:+ start:1663 stop:1983 length:321 start_codon:yes stop_codon:yes gene_type:complete
MNELSAPQARHAYWQKQMSIWKESGLSGAKFCEANNVSYHRFVYWRQKLGYSTAPKKAVPAASGFTRIAVQPERDDGLSLSLPNGLIVRGINAANLSVVRQLLDQY